MAVCRSNAPTPETVSYTHLVGLPEADVVGELVRVIIKTLLTLLRTPDPDAVLNKPLDVYKRQQPARVWNLSFPKANARRWKRFETEQKEMCIRDRCRYLMIAGAHSLAESKSPRY